MHGASLIVTGSSGIAAAGGGSWSAQVGTPNLVGIRTAQTAAPT